MALACSLAGSFWPSWVSRIKVDGGEVGALEISEAELSASREPRLLLLKSPVSVKDGLLSISATLVKDGGGDAVGYGPNGGRGAAAAAAATVAAPAAVGGAARGGELLSEYEDAGLAEVGGELAGGEAENEFGVDVVPGDALSDASGGGACWLRAAGTGMPRDDPVACVRCVLASGGALGAEARSPGFLCSRAPRPTRRFRFCWLAPALSAWCAPACWGALCVAALNGSAVDAVAVVEEPAAGDVAAGAEFVVDAAGSTPSSSGSGCSGKFVTNRSVGSATNENESGLLTTPGVAGEAPGPPAAAAADPLARGTAGAEARGDIPAPERKTFPSFRRFGAFGSCASEQAARASLMV